MINRIVLRDERSRRWLQFEKPGKVLCAESVTEVRDVLAEVHRITTGQGRYAAGYVGYEAAPAFDEALATQPPGRLPLACFGLFAEPRSFENLPVDEVPNGNTTEWHLTTPRETYLARVADIRRQIELGNCYQVNYTIRQEAAGLDDPWQLFLAVAADAKYAAYVDCDDHAIISASPELFFSLDNQHLTCRPMKGTMPRGTTLESDRASAAALHASVKDRAENVMIADMMRNDAGRIARTGTVEASSLYDIEKHRDVWQMTSEIAAKTDASVPEIFAALFPCASVTGAPKSSSMALIAELEDTPREIYTGTIGYFTPQQDAQFNVAIRTAWIDRKTNVGTYGIGSGVVWDSDPEGEFQECLSKAKVLSTAAEYPDFQLLETMLWTANDGYFLISEHLDRMQDSAEYFDFTLHRAQVLEALADLASILDGPRQRIRLLLDRDGSFHMSHSPEPDFVRTSPQQIRLAPEPVNAGNPFLYHKTTRRQTYENALQAVPEADDVLLWNSDGYITETTIANVIVSIDGQAYTPPVSCGLLGGTYRRLLLEKGEIEGRRIHIDELSSATELTLINSVRGQYSGTLLMGDNQSFRHGLRRAAASAKLTPHLIDN